MTDMHDQIQKMIDKFHRKVEGDERTRAEVEKIHKTLNIDLGSEGFSMILDKGRITDFNDHLMEGADITVVSTPESMRALIDGTLRPMKAYVTKKVTIKGKLDDIMHLRKLF